VIIAATASECGRKNGCTCKRIAIRVTFAATTAMMVAIRACDLPHRERVAALSAPPRARNRRCSRCAYARPHVPPAITQHRFGKAEERIELRGGVFHAEVARPDRERSHIHRVRQTDGDQAGV
jgi:hypothetical protein